MNSGSKQSDQDQRQQTTQGDERRKSQSDTDAKGDAKSVRQSDGQKYREDTRRVESPTPAEDERGDNAPQGRAGKAIVHPDDEFVDDPQEETAKRTNR